MAGKMKTRTTVAELIADLSAHPGDLEVRVWLPGSYIRLGTAFFKDADGKAEVLIEGNLEPGSALETPPVCSNCEGGGCSSCLPDEPQPGESGFPDRFGHYPGSDNLGESDD